MQDLEKQFDVMMFEIYQRAKSEARYNATIFLKMINERGGLATAKFLINAARPSDGYTHLYEKGRLDLTVEAMVVENAKWHELFESEEISNVCAGAVDCARRPWKMSRRITPSQYNALVRQEVSKYNQQVNRYNQEVDRVNRANKQVIDNHNRDVRRRQEAINREIRRYNQNAEHAVAKYNQAVRARNAQVRSDRQKLKLQIDALKSRPAIIRYSTIRTSTYALHEQLERVQQESAPSSTHANLIALSEHESRNSVAAMDALLDEAPIEPAEALEDSGILDYLAGFSQDLCDRWKGAIFAMNPANPDAARHFCTSVREIFTEILEVWADDAEVISANAACQRTPQGKPTRRSKIRFLLGRKGIRAPELAGFVEADIDNIVELFDVFNEATHGPAGKHGFAKLQAVRKRVEDGIMFLATVSI